MYEIVEEEYNQFLQDIADDKLVFERYIDDGNYEDEYSHNEIDEAKGLFVEKVKKHLHKNYPGKYIVLSSYCVFVMTPKEARRRLISEEKIKRFLIC